MVSEDARVDFWKARALSEQARGEEAEGQVILLRKQLEASQTRARLADHLAAMKTRGMDITVGEWKPDDTTERFVRVDGGVAEPPKS